MNCLNDPKIRRGIGDNEDDINDLMIQVQEANGIATNLLTKYGYWGELLKLTAKQAKELENNKKPDYKERIKALYKASTHGQKFYATHGDNCTSMNFFHASELKKTLASTE